MTQACGPCQRVNVHLYIVSSVATVILISICLWRDTRIQCNQVSDVKQWTPVDEAYGEKMTIRRCFALEAVLMQIFVMSACTSDSKEVFLKLD